MSHTSQFHVGFQQPCPKPMRFIRILFLVSVLCVSLWTTLRVPSFFLCDELRTSCYQLRERLRQEITPATERCEQADRAIQTNRDGGQTDIQPSTSTFSRHPGGISVRVRGGRVIESRTVRTCAIYQPGPGCRGLGGMRLMSCLMSHEPLSAVCPHGQSPVTRLKS